MRRATIAATALALLLAAGRAGAASITVTVHAVTPEGVGEAVGSVTIADVPPFGAVFAPDLEGLPPGEPGFHVHQHPDCGPVLLTRIRGRFDCDVLFPRLDELVLVAEGPERTEGDLRFRFCEYAPPRA